MLAMSAGRTVPTSRLATAVWGADAPGDPGTNVRANVKRLRRALGSAAPLVVARPGAYQLAVDQDSVDALRFGRLLDEAAAAPDPVVEQSRLAAALALWRGPPFDGIASDWLEQSVAPALQERYLTALERRVDLGLASGAPPDPTELTELAERHPLRESLWARLLRVLAASGRPAQALERYELIRRRLADELGTDPSPELRELHATLLAGGVPRGGGAVPRQLPAGTDGFAGRVAELAALDSLLRPPDQAGPAGTRSRSPLIAVITGTAGIGKTTLAVQWANRVADRFPDGQLCIDLRGYGPSGETVSSAAAIREFLDALQVPPQRIPEGPAAQAGLYRSLLAGRRMLILVDNARDADQVVPLLPGTPGCLTVVTSRDQLAGLVMTYGAHPITLGLLPPEEARRLLALRLGADRIAAEVEAADDIVDRCAGLPLALAIVAARAAIHPRHPLAALADELRDGLSALESTADMRAVFSWSYDALSDAAARLFRLVAGLHPVRDGTIATAASLAGVPASRVRAPLAELTRANLLSEHVPGRYSCHDLLRAYACELGQTRDTDLEAARYRLVDHYVHTASAAQRLVGGDVEDDIGADLAAPGTPGVCVTGFSGRDEAMAWFEAERPALLAALSLAEDLRLDRQVCRLARRCSCSCTDGATGTTGRRHSEPPWPPPDGWATWWNSRARTATWPSHWLTSAASTKPTAASTWPWSNHVTTSPDRRGRITDATSCTPCRAGRPTRSTPRDAHTSCSTSWATRSAGPSRSPTSAGTTAAWETTAKRLSCASRPWSCTRSPATSPTRPTRGRAWPTSTSGWATPPGHPLLPPGQGPVPEVRRPVRRGQHPRPRGRLPPPRRRPRSRPRAVAPRIRPPRRPRLHHRRPDPHPTHDHRYVRRQRLPPPPEALPRRLIDAESPRGIPDTQPKPASHTRNYVRAEPGSASLGASATSA
ncbi:NB-ARC domain-containing protein [Actinomadura madurae]|nr:NB-ARC domain-containing protein [Actinomadura madurae]